MFSTRRCASSHSHVHKTANLDQTLSQIQRDSSKLWNPLFYLSTITFSEFIEYYKKILIRTSDLRSSGIEYTARRCKVFRMPVGLQTWLNFRPPCKPLNLLAVPFRFYSLLLLFLVARKDQISVRFYNHIIWLSQECLIGLKSLV